MKVVLSIDPVRFPLTGVGRYTFELAKNLRNLPELELRYINGSRILRELPDLDNSANWAIQTKQNLKQQLLKYSPIVDFAQGGKSVLLSRSLRRHAADALFHGPNFYLPRFDGPRVATIHDLSIYKWEDSPPAERVRHMR